MRLQALKQFLIADIAAHQARELQNSGCTTKKSDRERDSDLNVLSSQHDYQNQGQICCTFESSGEFN